MLQKRPPPFLPYNIIMFSDRGICFVIFWTGVMVELVAEKTSVSAFCIVKTTMLRTSHIPHLDCTRCVRNSPIFPDALGCPTDAHRKRLRMPSGCPLLTLHRKPDAAPMPTEIVRRCPPSCCPHVDVSESAAPPLLRTSHIPHVDCMRCVRCI